ncbi:MAG: hypothetical protein PVF73_07800 [Bacteroidales bacterium]|jgi:hypothetical protein
MDSTYTFEKRKENYVCMKITGKYNYGKFISYIHIAFSECEDAGFSKIMVDAREVEDANISAMDRFGLGEEIAKVVGRRIQIAVIWPKQYINRFTETVAMNRGGNMRIFGTPEKGEEWLLGAGQA